MPDKENSKSTISHCIRILVLVLVPVLAIYISMSVISVYYLKKQIVRYTETVVNLYMNEIDNRIGNINRRLGMLVLGSGETELEMNSYIGSIKSTDNEALRNYYFSKLRESLRMYAMEYGTEFNFFVYFPQQNLFVGENLNDKWGQKEWEDYKRDLMQRLGERGSAPGAGNQYWQYIEGGQDCRYIAKIYSIKGVYMGCFIRPEDLMEPLIHSVENGKSTVLLYDQENQRIAGEPEVATGAVTIEKRFKNIPFTVSFTVYDYGLFQKMFFMQLFLVFLALIMLFVILSSIYYLYRKVMKPIKKFSYRLEHLGNGREESAEINRSELYELERANVEFRQLLKQIGNLQEEIYQAEIKKQMMYLNYLKIQIEPHFYLNCLNFIYNMIDLEQYGQARKMVVMTAEYMRYLFKNGSKTVCIWEELEHISRYLEIQKLRFQEAFDYYVEQEEETKGACIPPLIIQTFVENCMKYAVNMEAKRQLTVTIFSENVLNEPYINICVTDNGPGFSDTVLFWLHDRKNLLEGETEQIGISNAVKRLYDTYGEKAQIGFYNGPVNGAVVDIHIPFCQKEEQLRGGKLYESADC